MQIQPNGRVLQFGAFELKIGTGEVRKNGTRIRLQGKPLQLLEALLDRPGNVVTREELRDRLWAADTFVDFESGLNTAVNRLRLALGDSADRPRYVETLARSGYRFVAPVSESRPPAVIDRPPLTPAGPSAPQVSRGYFRRWWAPATVAVGLLLTVLFFLARRMPAPQPVFHQITFRRMTIPSARFGPDGQSVIYQGRRLPNDDELYLVNTVSPESRPLGFPGAVLAAVSRSGELALLSVLHGQSTRSLVRVPVNGGAPLPLDRGVWNADWSPDSSKMAVIRYGMLPETVEYPRGKTVFTSAGWMTDVRISRSGNELAFIDHPVMGDDGGNIVMIDAQGAHHTLSTGWASASGLAWAPSNREIWFTAARSGLTRALYAVSLSGKVRLIEAFPGTLTLYDISASGRVLIAREQLHAMMTALCDGELTGKDLSWFDYSNVEDISADGKVILFEETGEGGGPHHAVYVRKLGEHSAVRVGDGYALALSPDANWVVTLPDEDQTRLNLVPLTPGQPRTISGHGLKYEFGRFFPDGNRLLIGGSMRGGPSRLFMQSIDGSPPQPLRANVYLTHPAISDDSKWIAGVDGQQRLVVVPVEGATPRVIARGLQAVLRWSHSGDNLLVQSDAEPASLLRVDVSTGRYKPWREIGPYDLAGVGTIWPAVLSEDQRTLVYSYQQKLSELFVVDGWR
ncbi:MAG TPA: winged helix-turn-helix domain-containing protein [Bryobacteraceae bacterium]|nr:winged helix-turn-helix domain-containing protein [Bryobacteraceae bacterium]